MVVGSSYDSYSAEIVDLSGTNRICPEVTDYPLNYAMFGTYIAGSAITCGGSSPTDKNQNCYEYNPDDNEWVNFTNMTAGRYDSGTAFLNDTTWWVTGGGGSTQRLTTELYDVGSRSFSRYVDLPVSRWLHDIVVMDIDRIMLLGSETPTRDTYIFNKTSEEWTAGPQTSREHDDAFAGKVTYPNGTSAIIIAGGTGDDISDILNLDTEQWTLGPNLPYATDEGCTAEKGDTLLLIGGSGSNLDSILSYDLENNAWEILSAKLEIEKNRCASFLVPDDFVTCT